jgi:F-type H+-transporting ATPase subunit delta
MGDRSIARRYAKALIDVAGEANQVEAITNDLARLAEASRNNGGELFHALSNPVFTVDERKHVLDAVLSRLGVQRTTRNVLMLLLDKGRFNALPEVAEEYAAMADSRANRARVVVETAEPMSPQLEAEVRASLERVTGKAVVLQTRVNPDLIGGMVARVGSKVYDASIRARLEDIRQKLVRAQLPAEA